ncbi:MAG: hypothetical protein IPM55_16410 [Acidobacteria bacterium]|nr:hypothetical protein [Acidobacteriota bacterium]
MKISKLFTTTLCLILSLAQTLMTQSVFACIDGNPPFTTDASTTRLNSIVTVGMIGSVESSSEITINGRSVRGKESLRDGVIVRSTNASAQMTLDGIGKVLMSSESEMKISTSTPGVEKKDQHSALVATLIEGKAIFKLNPDSSAYVLSSGESFVSSRGAEFRLASNSSGPILRVISGDVNSMGSWTVELAPRLAEMLTTVHSARPKSSSRKYSIKAFESDNQTTVRAMEAKEFKFRVKDNNSRPVSGLPVTFTLNTIDGEEIGVLGYNTITARRLTVSTDAQGVAVVPFRAGSKPGSVSITAVAGDTGETENKTVTVTSAKEKFWTKKNAIPVLVTATAMIVAGIIVVATKSDRFPIKESSPILIIP